jgi:hypothetical protein
MMQSDHPVDASLNDNMKSIADGFLHCAGSTAEMAQSLNDLAKSTSSGTLSAEIRKSFDLVLGIATKIYVTGMAARHTADLLAKNESYKPRPISMPGPNGERYRAVEKGRQDADLPGSASIEDQIEQLSDDERALLMIKVSQQRPAAVKR